MIEQQPQNPPVQKPSSPVEQPPQPEQPMEQKPKNSSAGKLWGMVLLIVVIALVVWLVI